MMHAPSRPVLQAAAVLCIFAGLTSAADVILPIPGGALQLGTATAVLVDHSRTNELANNTDPRALPISVFYPVGYQPCVGGYLAEYVPQVVSDYEDNHFIPYGDLATIAYADFKSQMYRACAPAKNTTQHSPEYPVIIFSPGLGRTRLLYGALAQSVAKAGYVVVTIDHPYDVDIVQFPDGRIVYEVNEANFTDSDIDFATAIRVQDVSFVLDQLSHKEIARTLVPYDIDVSKVAMYGHSVGGATAANALISDPRVAGGLNMDGSLFGPVVTQGTDRPFLQFGQENHNHFNDQTINATWALLSGWHQEISFNGTKHGTFGDLAFLIHTLGLSHSGNESQVVGSVDGLRSIEIEQLVITEFFDFVFTGNESQILQCNDEGYPDLSCALSCIPGETCGNF